MCPPLAPRAGSHGDLGVSSPDVGAAGPPSPGAGGRSCAERLARKAILFLVSWMMHSTWRCITHSCYITLARKFKTSGLGWKWWFNYYLWITTTTAREKKGLKTFFFFFFPLCLKPAHLSHYSDFVPSSLPAPAVGSSPRDGLPAGATFGLGLAALATLSPSPPRVSPPSWPPPQSWGTPSGTHRDTSCTKG